MTRSIEPSDVRIKVVIVVVELKQEGTRQVCNSGYTSMTKMIC